MYKKLATVTLVNLARHFTSGETVSPASLRAKRLVSAAAFRRGAVKLIGAAALTQTLTVEGCLITPGARRSIEGAGGKIC
jgi:ribosomal protein L15